MSERIDYNNIRTNEPLYKDFERSHTAGHNEIKVDVHRLHERMSGHPVEMVALTDVVEQLNYPCWQAKDTEERFAPIKAIDVMVAAGPEEAKLKHPELAEHIERILTADRSYPVYMHEGEIIDGMHRLAQVAYLNKIGTSEQDFLTVMNIKHIPEGALIREE